MRRVLLLATGDTIAHSLRPGHEAVATGADLLEALPAGVLTAEVVVEDVMAEPSWDMSPSTMLSLARRARSAVLDDGYDGVVITHGTDTLEDTAFLVDLMAGAAARRGGIVLTGAVRAFDDLSPDGPRNLAASIVAAADPGLRGAGAVVCLNDELHAARWVTRLDATSVSGFSSAPFGALGRVVDGRVEPLTAPPARAPCPPASRSPMWH
ncbi:asparaginase domain-containing protein [Actinomadura alba]|uniref:asparaginase domain-containing protein n=1 Tax=Actinomadura alba TaxID=406431 RepID=UPI0031D23646